MEKRVEREEGGERWVGEKQTPQLKSLFEAISEENMLASVKMNDRDTHKYTRRHTHT